MVFSETNLKRPGPGAPKAHMELPIKVLNSFGVPKLQAAHKMFHTQIARSMTHFVPYRRQNTQDASVLTWKRNKQTNTLRLWRPNEQKDSFFCHFVWKVWRGHTSTAGMEQRRASSARFWRFCIWAAELIQPDFLWIWQKLESAKKVGGFKSKLSTHQSVLFSCSPRFLVFISFNKYKKLSILFFLSFFLFFFLKKKPALPPFSLPVSVSLSVSVCLYPAIPDMFEGSAPAK